MKNFRKLTALLLVFAMLFAFAACGTSGDEAETSDTTSTTSEEREVKTKIAALYGPTGIGIAKLKADRAYGYDVEYYSDPQDVVPLVVNGEVDMACLPLNLAANLYQKTNGNIQILAINTLGILHVLEKGDSIQSVADLKGKTIYASGQGATPEYTFDYLLEQNGIDPDKDVDIQYVSTHAELATMATEGKADIVVLPEPFASKVLLANTDYREALDVTEEWNKISDTELAFGCMIARKDYIEANPDIISEFMTFYEVSINYVTYSADQASTVLIDQGFFSDYDTLEAALPGCNVVFIDGEEMKTMAEANFEVLYNADPTSVGGQIPDDGIYYLG